MGRLRSDNQTVSPQSKSNTLSELLPTGSPEDKYKNRPAYGNGNRSIVSKIRKRKIRTKNKTNQQVIVISYLGSDYNITKMVDQLLTTNDLADDSSIVMVVPISDEEDNVSSSSRYDSTVCNIQLAGNSKKWNSTIEQGVHPSCSLVKKSHVPSGIRISTKGKRVLLQAVPSPVASIHNMQNKCQNEPLATKEKKLYYEPPPHADKELHYEPPPEEKKSSVTSSLKKVLYNVPSHPSENQIHTLAEKLYSLRSSIVEKNLQHKSSPSEKKSHSQAEKLHVIGSPVAKNNLHTEPYSLSERKFHSPAAKLPSHTHHVAENDLHYKPSPPSEKMLHFVLSPHIEKKLHNEPSPPSEKNLYYESSPPTGEMLHYVVPPRIEKKSHYEPSSSSGKILHYVLSPHIKRKIHNKPSTLSEKNLCYESCPPSEKMLHYVVPPHTEKSHYEPSPPSENILHYMLAPNIEKKSYYEPSPHSEKNLHYESSHLSENLHYTAAQPTRKLNNMPTPLRETNLHYASATPIIITNKFCQITTPMLKNNRVVSTDTTQDRPCCCPVKQQTAEDGLANNYNDQCIKNYWTKFTTSPLIETGLNNKDFTPSQHSLLLINEPTEEQKQTTQPHTLRAPLAYRRRLMFSNFQHSAAWRNLVKVNNSIKAMHRQKGLRKAK